MTIQYFFQRKCPCTKKNIEDNFIIKTTYMNTTNNNISNKKYWWLNYFKIITFYNIKKMTYSSIGKNKLCIIESIVMVNILPHFKSKIK